MPFHTYPYELPPLPYAYDALEPYIDAETMRYHHDKHFQTYIEGLNKALAPYPHLQKCRLEELLSAPARLPDPARCAILRNGGGVYNHSRFFRGMAPAQEDGHRPEGGLAQLIDQTFTSFDHFKEVFSQAALEVFGSGWAVLALTPRGKLKIVQLRNQETTLPAGALPLLYIDVWEHAYYLKYKNLRAEYVKNIWNVLAFPAL
ncbi:MAG: superoxide dismutase [Clostridiales bacterium]|nr:superoxide dismutase [Clostridiales bacterium]